MKTAFPVLAAFIGIAGVATGETNKTLAASAKGALEGLPCDTLGDDLRTWFYNTRNDGPYKCKGDTPTEPWSMMNAYRSGGTEGVHWKYTDNVNDGECLKNWKYYSSDGQTLIATISGRTTTQNDPRRWCALPVYRSGGVKGKQWEACNCFWGSGRT